MLVKILESNAAGCRWLREEWQALCAQLESTGFWQSHDRLKATRLLGRQPVEANEDRRVATIFVASHALSPAGKTEFDDLLSDMEDSQRDRYGKAVCERWPDLFGTRKKAEWRQILLALADQNIERLTAKLEVHEANADAQAERTFARLSFDPSPEGEALRNYLIKCTNALFRGMANYRKYQAGAHGRWDGASGVGRHETQLDRSADRRRETHERAGSELGADDSFGPGDGQDDRLERADAIDPDGVEKPGDEMNGTVEIGENAPSEANFAETTSIVESQESIQVTANSGALSGLDKGAAQPGDGTTPEQGQAPRSASKRGTVRAEPPPVTTTPAPRPALVHGSPTIPTRRASEESYRTDTPAQDLTEPTHQRGIPSPEPSLARRASMRSLPATVSEREERRLRLEEERRLVERMVEEKLKAGNFSPREILTSAMALPLSGGRGP